MTTENIEVFIKMSEFSNMRRNNHSGNHACGPLGPKSAEKPASSTLRTCQGFGDNTLPLWQAGSQF